MVADVGNDFEIDDEDAIAGRLWPLSAWARTINKEGRRRQWLKDLRILR